MVDSIGRGQLLVGRQAEVETVAQAVREVVQGRGASLWVEGESGIGKSLVVQAGLAVSVDSGLVVLKNSAHLLNQARPLAVLMESHHDDGSAGVLMDLVEPAGANGLTSADTTAALAYRLVEWVESRCLRSPMVFVVDDLQWADEASLLVWRRLAEVARQAPLVLIGMSRRAPDRAEVGRLRNDLLASGTDLVALDPLPVGDVEALVAALAGGSVGPGLMGLVERAGGNPLYVRELVEAVLRSGGVVVRDGVADVVAEAGDDVPASVKAAIEHRLGCLSEDLVALLRVAAVLGPEFHVDDLAVVVDRPATSLLSPVMEAVESGVLAGVRSPMAFRHGLIWQVMYTSVPVELRAALHRQVGQALAGRGVPAVRVGAQLLAAARLSSSQMDDEWVVGWTARNATELVYRAPQLAAELLAQVGRGTRIDPVTRQRIDVARIRALDLSRAREEVLQAAPDLLAGASVPEVVAEAVWLYARNLSAVGRGAQVGDLVGPILSRTDLPPGWAARLRVVHAIELIGVGPSPEGAAMLTEAEAEASVAGDRFALAYALFGQAFLHRTGSAGWQRLLDLLARAQEAAGDLIEAVDLCLTLMRFRGVAYENLERSAEAGQALRDAVALAERQATPQIAGRIRMTLSEWLILHGQWDEALAELTACENAGIGLAMYSAVGQRTLIALHRDDAAELTAGLAIVDQLNLDDPRQLMLGSYLLRARALAPERDGRPRLAVDRLTDLFDRIVRQFGYPDPDAALWLADGVRLALAAGDQAKARDWAQLAASTAQAYPTAVPKAGAQHCAGLLASDPQEILAAAQTLTDDHRPLPAAQAYENAAVILAEHSDLATARAAYAQAAATYHELDARWDLRRGDQRVRRYGIRRTRLGHRPTEGWAALTPTELRVVDLVAAGRSNPEIASELFLSAHTVRTHVSHVLAKLDVRTRVDIAREAEKRHGTGR